MHIKHCMSASPVRSLRRDHQQLRQVLDCLDHFVDTMDEHQPIDRERLGDFVTFFRSFGDAYYATKVDERLLPFLTRKAHLDAEFLEGIRQDHQHQRYFVDAMDQFASSSGHDADGRRGLRARIQEFSHSKREVCRAIETTAFPVAEQLDERHRADLAAELEEFERASMDSPDRLEIQRVTERLAQAFSDESEP